MKLYKLTDQHGRSGLISGCTPLQWAEGVNHSAPGTGQLCGPGWIHAYTDPLLAAFLNPIHGNFDNPLCWEMDNGEVGTTDHGLKVGVRIFRADRVVPLPAVTIEQRVSFGILCALEVYRKDSFYAWAEKWMSGQDRSRAAAEAAARAAAAASWAARAAEAAEAAARAARAAEAAAAASWAARAAEAAARAAAAWAAAGAAAGAARAAAWEAAAAARAEIDLVAIARKAVSA